MSQRRLLAALIVVASFASTLAFAGKPATLWAFDKHRDQDGAYPNSTLLASKNGALFGETAEGGTHGDGTVFMLTANGKGKWAETVLYNFAGGTDGSGPVGGLAADSAGNLYGVTEAGGGTGCTGGAGCGIVFEIAVPKGMRENGSESVLYSFTAGSDGGVPYGAPVLRGGAVYGTTTIGGELAAPACSSVGCGVVYEIAPSKKGWHETVLYAFGGDSENDGATPFGGLLAGPGGTFYGVTENGGIGNNIGTVFALTKGQGGWSETILYAFAPGDVGCPLATLSKDAAGVLYGTGKCGGATADDGGVFTLAPPANGGTLWTYSTLYGMCAQSGCADGTAPGFSGATLLDGKLYGTAGGGRDGHGVLFALSPPKGGQGLWHEKLLYTFPAAQGDKISDPVYGVTAQKGTLYGMTFDGGSPVDTGAAYGIAP